MHPRLGMVNLYVMSFVLLSGCQSQLVDSGATRQRPSTGPVLVPPTTGEMPRDQVPHIAAASVVGPLQSATTQATSAYQIQAGESWSTVASRFGISLDQLLEANGADTRSSLQAGDWIVIPASR